MTNYVKIDRATGDILKRKKAASMERVFDKTSVWIELEKQSQPVYDEDTQKLVSSVTQPDMSDLNVDVSPTAKRVEGWDIVALNAGELNRRKQDKIANLDHTLTRIAEDVMVAIATGQPLERASFPPQVWATINARRSLRGQADV